MSDVKSIEPDLDTGISPRFGYDYKGIDPINKGTGEPFNYINGDTGELSQVSPLQKFLEHAGVGSSQQLEQAHLKHGWVRAIADEAHNLANSDNERTASEEIAFQRSVLNYVERTWFHKSKELIEAETSGDHARAVQLANQLNSSMREIYALPEATTAASLIAMQSADNPELAQLYGTEIGSDEIDGSKSESLEIRYAEVLEQIRDVIIERYGPLVDEFVPDDEREYTPEEAVIIINGLIHNLIETDQSVAWTRVTAVIEKNDLDYSTSSERGQVTVNVPGKGTKISARLFRGMISHELLWHAARGANGWEKGKLNDTAGQLQGKGMPQYLSFEEAGAIISELSFVGHIDQVFIDRYTDIALAAGVLDGRIRTRPELQKFVFKREMIRQGLASTDDLSADRQQELHTHIDRIYRGGSGGDDPGTTVIYPKDAEYFGGVEPFLKWWQLQTEHGFTPEELYDRCREGKNDLTQESHADYLDELLEKQAA